MNNNSYLITPFLAWLAAGCIKFLINSIRAKKLAFSLIGYGGLPSNHSAIVSSMTALIVLNEGIYSPAFGVALTLSFIVLLDANSLRRAVGQHAVLINQLVKDNIEVKPLRERMGHSKVEIVAGIVVGIFVAIIIKSFLGGYL
ncbi:divergent PAP2 family protein [Acinetobacter rudis]|uniref:Divergent PAP2 family protein n=1 Tax=Acinetobacter rudis TaxID=632955 RepID=A0AAW8J6U5_9GAMM|nr:divergent PAP2 family protein [Acinetobacter rudis]MDQ8935158.1 divergent PAP2 family protein [Acinetobacter rudis]MDQ8953021.1 divergent PAP2 family protein [Acinetobacter rudis]MDQ9017026.1 divergent PAP2 family protein [Acinetobacter rudis]